MKKSTIEFKNEYLSEISKAWGKDAKMMQYFDKKLSDCYMLSSGYMVPFDKEKIKKDFCFGYSDSAYDTNEYDHANKMVEKASKDVQYFVNENMKEFKYLLKNLKEPDFGKHVYIERMSYTGETSKMNLMSIKILSYSRFIELKENFNADIREVSETEIKELISFVEIESEKHFKKVQTYLKKYGLSNVNAWSYWRDI